jgi:hypothetical protein
MLIFGSIVWVVLPLDCEKPIVPGVVLHLLRSHTINLNQVAFNMRSSSLLMLSIPLTNLEVMAIKRRSRKRLRYAFVLSD